MPEPEIARRCPTCGASIREAALFCPQCGDGLSPQKSAESSTGVADMSDRAASKNTSPLSDSGNEAPTPTVADTVAIPKTDNDPKALAVDAAKKPVAPGVRGAVGAKIQRATTLARDVEGDVMHRARKVRKISSVVLDEAGYDPSLRFVLVAAGLFILFVIIVLLNKFIT